MTIKSDKFFNHQNFDFHWRMCLKSKKKKHSLLPLSLYRHSSRQTRFTLNCVKTRLDLKFVNQTENTQRVRTSYVKENRVTEGLKSLSSFQCGSLAGSPHTRPQHFPDSKPVFSASAAIGGPTVPVSRREQLDVEWKRSS